MGESGIEWESGSEGERKRGREEEWERGREGERERERETFIYSQTSCLQMLAVMV